MIDNLKEAITHAKEKATKLKRKAESIYIKELGHTQEVKDCLECAKDHEQLAEWLEELAERREADRWNFIHTEADLPKESDYYLVTSEVRQGRKYVCLAFYDASKGKFLKDASISVLGVIAWKPLPKPYESEEENETDN